MAQFNPKTPEVGELYQNSSITLKVTAFDGTKVKACKSNETGDTVGSEQPYTSYTWNRLNLRLITGQTQGSRTNTVSPAFTFYLDESGNLTIKDKNNVIVLTENIKGPKGQNGEIGPQGPIGNDGANGLTWSPRITEDGLSLYFVNDRGERSTSYRFKGETGEHGSQGPAGPAGRDADLWKPQITSDGKHIFFVNQRGEESEKYPIQGARGDRGETGATGPEGPIGPVFIPSVNSDGEISWSNNGGMPNPTPINIRGSKGDAGNNGAIFHPVVVDGYLTWTNDQGLPNPDPVKIQGPQGEVGESGREGKSAYQLWLDCGNVGTLQDFLDSLKGEKGEAAEQISTGYQDVDDYHCKVEKINTDLIVNSEAPSESPEEIITRRTEEIEKLRRDGHDPDMQKQMNVGWFKKAMWWCAGADRDLLTMCPGDHSKYVGVGTVILFTALMAFFSSFIAMRLVFGVAEKNIWNLPSLGAAIFALFWGSMIFFLDRFITNTMYSDGKVSISKQEFFSGLPRIVIAIFLGIVISAPLELMIFKDEVNNQIYNVLRDKNKIELVHEYKINIDSCNGRIDSYQKQKLSIIENQAKIPAIQQQISSIVADRDKSVADVKVKSSPISIRRHYGESDEDYNDRKMTAQGKADSDRNTRLTAEKNAVSKPFQSKIDSLTDIIINLRADTSQFNNLISLEKSKICKYDSIYNSRIQKADSVFMQHVGLQTRLSALHNVAMDGYKPYNGAEESSLFDYISLHPLFYFLFSSIGLIMLLFILIDISPVLYKMMLADGKYDNYLHQEKLLAQDKIRLSLSKMLRKLDDSELKRVAPFIMGDIYEKMAGDSYVFKTEAEFMAEMANLNRKGKIWNLWPLSWIRWIFWKEDSAPSAPVIILGPKEPSIQQQRINTVNQDVFEEVLDMKRRIILASYRRWYKRQHDNILGDRVDDENVGRDAFEESDDSNNA